MREDQEMLAFSKLKQEIISASKKPPLTILILTDEKHSVHDKKTVTELFKSFMPSTLVSVMATGDSIESGLRYINAEWTDLDVVVLSSTMKKEPVKKDLKKYLSWVLPQSSLLHEEASSSNLLYEWIDIHAKIIHVAQKSK